MSPMYKLECNVQEQSSDKQAEWCGWSCMYYVMQAILNWMHWWTGNQW